MKTTFSTFTDFPMLRITMQIGQNQYNHDQFGKRQEKNNHKPNSNPTNIFCTSRFFQQNMEMKELFANFRYVELDDAMRENEALEAHGTLVMTVIDEVISNINDVDKTVDMLKRIHNQHLGFQGFHSEFFWVCSIWFLPWLC